MRGLAGGEKGYEKYEKLFAKKFVFLNEYTTSVQAEHDPRGPEGPYRFVDRSVPVLVIKRWDGKTMTQQLGFVRGAEEGQRRLRQIVDKVLKDHGPVVAPKALRPLNKSFAAGMKNLEKGRRAAAWKDFDKVVRAGGNKKKFPHGLPTVAEEAQAEIAKILAAIEEEMKSAAKDAEGDPVAGRKAYRKLLRSYAGIPPVKKKILAAIKALPKD